MNDIKINHAASGRCCPALTVLNTDISDLEECCLAAGESAKRKCPADFQGERAAVFFRLPYTVPYERFDGLRRLIDRLRRAAGFRWSYVFRGVLWLDVTAWRGHEAEAYFRAVLKYLSDHAQGLSISLCATAYQDKELRALRLACCDCGFRSRVIQQQLFDRDTLTATLKRDLEKAGADIQPEAVLRLGDAILAVEPRWRSAVLLCQVEQELLACAGPEKHIREQHICKYLESDNVLCLLTGNERKERQHGKDFSL